MRAKLAAGQYSRPMEIAADASRVFTVPPGAPDGGAAAAQMRSVFEALWQQLLAPYAHL